VPKSMNELAASRAPVPRRTNLHLNWPIRQLPRSRNAIRHPELQPTTRPIVSCACRNHDLVDPITLLIATGLRESELLGLL